MTLTRKNHNAHLKRERLAISHVIRVAQNLAISFVGSCEIGFAMILIIIITLERPLNYTQPFSLTQNSLARSTTVSLII